MQRKALTIAVAAALSAVAGSASAVYGYKGLPVGYNNLADTTVIKISGSSSTNNQTKVWAQKFLCSANQVTWTKDSNNFAVVCVPNLNLGFTPGKNIAVIKNSSGGSGNGVKALRGYVGSDSLTLGYINVFQLFPDTGAPGGPTPADLGVIDEEPNILLKAGAISNIYGNRTPINVVTFGTPVTLGLYHALVDSQILSGKINNTSSPVCRMGIGASAVYSYVESCMPSLSQSQIASIFAGTLASWSGLGLTNTDNNIYIARRVITSGTQTASRIFFLNDPCADNMAQFVAGNLTKLGVIESPTKADACNAASYTDPAGIPTTVFEGSGGGNVEACLTNHDRNGRWAIGVNSLELPSTTDTTNEYTPGGGALVTTGGVANKLFNKDFQRHIKIDGFAPTTFNTATGRYRFWYEAYMNTPPGSPSPDEGALWVAMANGFNSPAVLAELNASFNTTVLLGASKSAGILVPAQFSNPPLSATEAHTTLVPEMYYTRNLGAPNSCQPAMNYWATGLNP